MQWTSTHIFAGDEQRFYRSIFSFSSRLFFSWLNKQHVHVIQINDHLYVCLCRQSERIYTCMGYCVHNHKTMKKCKRMAKQIESFMESFFVLRIDVKVHWVCMYVCVCGRERGIASAKSTRAANVHDYLRTEYLEILFSRVDSLFFGIVCNFTDRYIYSMLEQNTHTRTVTLNIGL